MFGADARHGGDDVVMNQAKMKVTPRGDHYLVLQVILNVALQPLEQVKMTANANRAID